MSAHSQRWADSQRGAIRALSVASAVMAPFVSGAPGRAAEGQTTSLRALVEKVQIRAVAVSPAREFVAYAELRARLSSNDHSVALKLQSTAAPGPARLLASYGLTPPQLFNLESHVLNPAAVQFVWSKTDDGLLFTDYEGGKMRLLFVHAGGADRPRLCGSADRIEIQSPAGDGQVTVKMLSSTTPRRHEGADEEPLDLALLVKDGQSFDRPVVIPKVQPVFETRLCRFDWVGAQLVEQSSDEHEAIKPSNTAANPGFASQRTLDNLTRDYLVFDHWDSADGLYRVETRFGRDKVNTVHLAGPTLGSGKECFRSEFDLLLLGAGGDERHVYFLEAGPTHTGLQEMSVLSGEVRVILKAPNLLSPWTRPARCIDSAGRIVVVKSGPTEPESLVVVDPANASMVPLSEPNRSWQSHRMPVTRYIDLASLDLYAQCGGRLFLPSGMKPGVRLPLVITPYSAAPEFVGGVGDELPILPLVESGIAVFDLRAMGANRLAGGREAAISRLRLPLKAMEGVIAQLSAEGLIDPSRVGVQGLSYGAQISGYAWWASAKTFRAVSNAGGGFKVPETYALSGVTGTRVSDEQGLGDPFEQDGSDPWRELSNALKAGPALPPLLVQGAEFEILDSAPFWTRARRAGAPVEWFIYPNEGHEKCYPVNKWWVLCRNLDWFRFWLKDEEDPNPAKAEQYVRWRKLRMLHEAGLKAARATN